MKRNEAVKRLLNVYRSRLGLGEDPPGSNHNLITVWYNKNIEKIGDGPWCEMTHAWAFETAGFEKLRKPRAYTPYAAGDAQKKVYGTSWHLGTKGMMVGDVLYFDWDGDASKTISQVDHTGIVEHFYDDGTFDVLEGNTGSEGGGKLKRVRRNSKYVTGYVRVDWSRLLEDDEPSPAPRPTPTREKLEVDGKLGPLTIKAWQRQLGTTVDGIIDDSNSELVKAVQRRLRETVKNNLKVNGNGIKQNGSYSPTVAALQTYLGSPVDGRISSPVSNVVKALQRRLNEGKF